MKYAKSVEEFFQNHDRWAEGLLLLRSLALKSGMSEALKWGAPVYQYNGKNIVGLSAFKSYFGLWFYQGALLEDKQGILYNAQEGKTKALRQWRFSSAEQVDPVLVSQYIEEAVGNQKKGLEIKPETGRNVIVPDELTAAFSDDPDLQSCYEALTLSKRREYAEYITEAKRTETRQRRLTKCIPMIREGVGLNDKYRSS